ncbi:MAG: DUF1460 domain-containing protein [Bacteroidetes bacterium]|nr:DUF1460 domain-containing protein [Bacteroidota bacterium]
MQQLLGFCVFLLFSPIYTQSQTVCDLESKAKLEATLEKFSHSSYSQLAVGDLIATVGKSFLGTPYAEKTLELPGEEQLVINLMGLDCTTFVESVLALVTSLKQPTPQLEEVEKALENFRYLQGKNSGYSSRLHYFSDWIYENEKAGRISHLSKSLGGTVSPNIPSFMSANPRSYPQLADPIHLKSIKEREVLLATRKFYFIPKEKIHLIEGQLQNGDILAITTPIKNLDVVHVGFAVKKDERVYLMHASSVSRKVEISSLPLQEYLMKNRSQTGILISRLVLL